MQRWHKHVHCYASMDVIPGRFGVKPALSEIEEAAEASYKNWRFMRKQGLDPIAVFHPKERLYWLEKYLGEGAPKIGFGASRVTGRIPWLDKVLGMVVDHKDREIVHGFGMTDLVLVPRYPQLSQVDSLTWRAAAYNGGLLIPSMDDPVKQYHLKISSKTGHHASAITRMGPTLLRHAQKWVESCGFTWEQAITDYKVRELLCIRYISSAIAHINKDRHRPLRHFYVCGKNHLPLDQEGISDRLISYASLYKDSDETVSRLFNADGTS